MRRGPLVERTLRRFAGCAAWLWYRCCAVMLMVIQEAASLRVGVSRTACGQGRVRVQKRVELPG